MTAALFVSVLIAWISFRRKAAIKRMGRGKTLSFKIAEETFELAAVLAGVLAFYHVLLALLAFGWDNLSAGTLLRLQDWLTRCQELLERYKLSWTTTSGILILLFVLGLRIRFLADEIPFKFFKAVRKTLRIVSLAAFLLCAFTLLGFDPGKPAATLAIHLQKQRSDYGVLQHELKDALAGSIASRVAEKATQALPGGPARVLKTLDRIENASGTLRKTYESAQAKYEIHDGTATSLLRNDLRRRAVLEGTEAEASSRATIPGKTGSANVPQNVSEKAIETASSNLESLRRTAHPELLKVLKRPGGKDIVLQLPDLVVGKTSELLSHHIAEVYPFLKPVLEAVTSIMTDAIKLPLEKKLDELTRAVLDRPSETENLLRDASTELADSVRIDPGSIQGRVSERSIQELDREADQMEASVRRLEIAMTRAEERRNDELIERLSSSREDARVRAAKELSGRGEKLSLQQVRRVTALMREGDQRWTVSTEREGHCTWYETISIRYYAGRALENMKSPYVDVTIARQAVRAQTDAKSRYKVTDPGWV